MVLAPRPLVQIILKAEVKQTFLMVRCIDLFVIKQVFMSEEDSEEEFSDNDTPPVGGPSVITFRDPSKKSDAFASDTILKRTFMVRDSYGVL